MTNSPLLHIVSLRSPLIATTLAAVLGAAGCLSTEPLDPGVSNEELKSLFAADEAMQDSDQAILFEADDAPTGAHATPEWNKQYVFGDLTKDYFPRDTDYFVFPIAVVKLVIWLPDQIVDWVRGSEYEQWTFTNTGNEPMNFKARVTLDNLNWRVARGKASIKVCKVDAAGQDVDCDKRGSVKRHGTKTRNYIYISWANSSVTREFPTADYARDYPISVPAGETYRVYLKHKLECTAEAWNFSNDNECVIEPLVAIAFIK